MNLALIRAPFLRILEFGNDGKNVNVVSFANATLVPSIGDEAEKVSDSGFLDTTLSLAV